MFVGAIIVYDEVQVEFGWGFAVDFLEETDKFLVPMARHTVADYFAVEHAEGCEEGGRAVAFIIVRPSPATALLHREARLGAVEGLDLTLLVHTQNQGLVRRIQIQTNDVAEFLDKAFIAAELEGPDQMRLEVVLLPDPLDSCLAETLGSGHATRAPVGGIGGGGVQRSFNYRSDFFHWHPRFAPGTGSVLFQPQETQGQKTRAPELDRRPRYSQDFGHVLAEDTVSGHRDNLRSHHFPIGEVSSTCPCVQGGALFWG